MTERMNPLGREYTAKEWKAAKRVGMTVTTRNDDWHPGRDVPPEVQGGPLVFATGPGWPDFARREAKKARKLAADWDLVADAMDREWKVEAS